MDNLSAPAHAPRGYGATFVIETQKIPSNSLVVRHAAPPDLDYRRHGPGHPPAILIVTRPLLGALCRFPEPRLFRRPSSGLPPPSPDTAAPLTPDLLQGRRGIFDRLPRLDTAPRDYADLRSLLQAIELQALGRPADAFHSTMQQLHPRLQTHIRTCMIAQRHPTRTPYDHMVSILMHQVVPGKPGDYLYQTIAIISRRSHAQISYLRMQITEAHNACRDFCSRVRPEMPLVEHYVVKAFLAELSQDIARDTRDQASAANRLSYLQNVAPFAIDKLDWTYPGKREQRPQDANTLTVDDNFYAATEAPAPAPSTVELPRPWRRIVAPTPPRRPPSTQTPRKIFQSSPETPWAPLSTTSIDSGSLWRNSLTQQHHRPHPTSECSLFPLLPAFSVAPPPTVTERVPLARRNASATPPFLLNARAVAQTATARPSCRRRPYHMSSTRFNKVEVDRNGRSYCFRDDLPSPARFRCGLRRAILPREGPPPPASVARHARHLPYKAQERALVPAAAISHSSWPSRIHFRSSLTPTRS
ncbi:hypothetical protein ACSSS7_004655 [Eimeria intestinalis]